MKLHKGVLLTRSYVGKGVSLEPLPEEKSPRLLEYSCRRKKRRTPLEPLPEEKTSATVPEGKCPPFSRSRKETSPPEAKLIPPFGNFCKETSPPEGKLTPPLGNFCAPRFPRAFAFPPTVAVGVGDNTHFGGRLRVAPKNCVMFLQRINSLTLILWKRD